MHAKKKGPDLHLGTTTAVMCLMSVYDTPAVDTIFQRAFKECVCETDWGCAKSDFNLYAAGQTASIPPYIERACRNHGVWPWNDDGSLKD
jgi:hypothetical protein